MENILPIHLQEIIFSSSDSKISKQISKLKRNGKIRKIAKRVYSSNLTDPPEEIIRRNLFKVLGGLYPGAILSHRSAFEFEPTEEGHIFLTYSYTKKVHLPGIILRFLEGHEALPGDNQISVGLFASQRARAFLENLQPSKNISGSSKCLPRAQLEDKLEQIIRVNGEEELNNIRDRAREIASMLKMEKEYEELNKSINALLTTHTPGILSSPIAVARAFGFPYDPARIKLFEDLFRELISNEFKNRTDRNTTNESMRNFAFFESYFSNYIEGTVFEVAEVKRIIESNKPLPARSEDSHDVLGTYKIVSNRHEMSVTPDTAEDLLRIIKYRHKILLEARPEKEPGLLKNKNNFAGLTSFVDFNLVRGTMLQSFDYYKALNHPFARAAYIMFVISEVHPFHDGNGRIARIMMNAELVKAGHSKIIIPTVYRDDYLGTLRKFTRQSQSKPYIKMLQTAQEFSENIYGDNYDEMLDYLNQCNSFSEHTEAKLKIRKR
ncbi:MAG: Fic family protein [Bacteroidales bacterium]